MPQILLCEAHPSEEQERADSRFGKHRNGSATIAALLLAQEKNWSKRMHSHCPCWERMKLLGCMPAASPLMVKGDEGIC